MRPNSVTTAITVSFHAAPKRLFGSGERAVERAEHGVELAVEDAFARMDVPAFERQRADARTVGMRKHLRGAGRRLSIVGAQLRGALRLFGLSGRRRAVGLQDAASARDALRVRAPAADPFCL